MKTNKLSKCLLALCLIVTCGLSAQQEKQVFYNLTEVAKADASFLGAPQIVAANSKIFLIDPAVIQEQMKGVAHTNDQNKGFVGRISFPHPDGSMHEYRSMANTVMHPELAAKFPEIKAYDAYDDNGATVKWDITPHGLHVMIRQPGVSTIFIDPVIKGNNQYYIVYYKKDFQTDKTRECSFDSDAEGLKMNIEPSTGTIKSFGSCQLRTYRLALSATGEYTTFHGGTVALAQAAQVTTMNRVNGVYENEMAVTMTIIANNNLIVYTNAATDPFTNGNPGSMITQNQNNTTTVIGSANYDIGHVFGTNSGGLAGLGVVCSNSNKARGVTGSGAPIGDPFDIDYVAHEIGHQFGCNHTFAGTVGSCNGNGTLATAMEPGSGTTIMAYAGICGALNVQSNSDDNFHGISLQQMGAFVTTGNGNTCPVTTSLSNNAPVLVSTNGNVTIPGGTPFALTAVATDADGDPLTYNWEQMNNAFQSAVPSPTATTGPNFRAKPSTVSPTRYFPALPGGSTTWEMLPTVSRTLNFRCVVRDNAPGAGGCNDHEDITVTVDGNSGPFVVTYPSATGISWAGNSTQTVTWSVAGTNAAPVACANVDILLSTDGGLTYPTVLATNVPNDGSQVITVPNTATTTARIMVICSNGTFFDISDNNFTITAATFDYTMSATLSTVSVCQPNNATFTINIGSIGGYNSPVTLSVSGVPAGATSNFNPNPVTPVGSSTLTISNTGAAAPGSYTLTITGNSASGTKVMTVTLIISSGAPSAVTLLTPANAATGVSVPTNFTWSPAGGVVTYDIDISTSPAFASFVDQATGLTATNYTSPGLLNTTTYYWRVRAVSGCGTSAWSSTFSFTTGNCGTFISTDVPKAVGAASVTSVLNIVATGTITDLNVASLNISHVYVGDVSATLTSPTGTVVSLFNGPGIPASTYGCSGDNIIVSFDDAAALTATDLENMCNASPPAITGDFQSINPLSAFNGETITGTWTLTVLDSYTAGDNGTLNAWSLEICTNPSCTNPTSPTISGTTSICNGASTTLSIASGTLNDATNWQWYSGSCGGTPAGSGTSIVVSPSTTTTYFVRGEGGCVSPGACTSITVNVSTLALTSASQTNISCNGGSNGAASVNAATGGAGGFTYNWTPGNPIGDGTTSVTGLTAGTWTCTVTDANGCTSTQNFSITQPSTLGLSAASQTNISCNGGANGAASVNVATGGAGGYTYNWTPGNPTGDGTTSVTGLSAGTWTCTVTDANGCTNTQNFTITQPSVLGLTPASQTNIACNGGSTGAAAVNTATGGAGGYTYNWTPGNPAGDGTTSVTGLSAGTWTCTVTDANGCTNAQNFTITQPTTLVMTTLSSTDPTCGSSNGSASVNSASGGAGGYTYNWTPGNPTGDGTTSVTGLSAGTWTCTVTDANGCTTAQTFTLAPVDNTPPTLSCPGNQTQSANATCQALLADYIGMATVSDACDASPTVSQSPPAGTTISGPTVVMLTAMDASGNSSVCTFTVSLVDNTPPTLSCPGNQSQVANATCQALLADYTGMATVNDACDATPTVTQSPAAGTTISSATIVTLTVMDASGNSAICMFTVSLQDNTPPSISCPGTQNTCSSTMPDYTGLVTALDNCDSAPIVSQSPLAGSALSAGTTSVTITVTDASGNSSTCNFDVVVNSYNSTENASICFGDSYTFPDGTTGTTSQVYTSNLTTVQGCDSIVVTTLTVSAQLDASVTQSGANLSANAGGMSYQWIDCDNGNAPISGATNQNFTPTAITGNYAVIVSSGGCSETSACYLVDFTGLDELNGGTIQLYPNPASGQVTIEWSGDVNQIDLTDAQGKLIYRAENPSGTSYILHVEQLSAGMYFVHVFNQQGRQVLDLVKE